MLTILGLGLGFLLTAVGYGVYALLFTQSNGISHDFFWRNVVMDPTVLNTEIITAAVLPSIITFFLLIRSRKQDALASGILISILLSVMAFILYFI